MKEILKTLKNFADFLQRKKMYFNAIFSKFYLLSLFNFLVKCYIKLRKYEKYLWKKQTENYIVNSDMYMKKIV